jgi:hypothetical protein
MESMRLTIRKMLQNLNVGAKLWLLHFKIKKSSIAEKCLLKAVSVNRQDTISRVYLADCYLKK